MSNESNVAPPTPSDYFADPGRGDLLGGGARMIPVETPSGTLRVWTKRVGNNPRLRVLLLHGGPGATHEYLETFDSFLPAAGIEYYYYDQLGSGRSERWEGLGETDPMTDPMLAIERWVSEVDQVRLALGLGPDDFVLYGQSWGGLLAIEYALAHPEALKGLVVSNMMASIRVYDQYAQEVVKPALPADVVRRIEELEASGSTGEPEYEELLMEHVYTKHMCRLPLEEWPEPVVRGFGNINPHIYVPMQGPSELGASGRLYEWDRTGDLHRIETPTLVMAAGHDTMDPEHLRWMAEQLPNGRYHLCPDGGHVALADSAELYFEGLVDFLRSLD